ncbi:hypothetical protein EB796_000761 [Bugula neritina]|uniref:rhomboid protease n=1 Tax=Bugula neritina TaxID=10212 RepID=A0A7J7KRU6_BUGNE|nr:hypothetical protein EB796_000761 [Bugula neritina]
MILSTAANLSKSIILKPGVRNRLAKNVGNLRLGIITRSLGNIKSFISPKDLPLKNRVFFLMKPTILSVVAVTGASKFLKRDKKDDRSDAEKTNQKRKFAFQLIAINFGVFTIFSLGKTKNWRRITSFDLNYATDNVFGRAPILGSIFSIFNHNSWKHLIGNTAALAPILYCCNDHPSNIFVVYLTGGIFASYVSNLNIVFMVPNISLGLGASGAISALLAYSVTVDPEIRITLLMLFFGMYSDIKAVIREWQVTSPLTI